MESADQIAGMADRARAEARQLDAAARTLAGDVAPHQPTDRELDAAEAAVRSYRKGRSKPRVRQEVQRALQAAEAVRE